MKCQKSCGRRWGKLIHQLPRVLTFAYDLRFRRLIAHWKGTFENYKLFHQIVISSTFWLWQGKKTIFRDPKRPSKYKKMYWHENFQNKPFWLGGWPPISTWKICRDSNSPESVEPTIINKYRRTYWTKTYQEDPARIGWWPPIST